VLVVLFDIGGVFLHPHPAEPAPAGADGIDVLDWNSDQAWEEYKRGRLSEEVYWTMRRRRLGAVGGLTWRALKDWDARCVRLDPALPALVGRLRPTVRRAALSNAGAELEPRLAAFGLDTLFELVVNSHRVGLAKPEAAVYRYTARLLGVPAHRILFIDDRSRNTEAAAQLGFRVWVYGGADGLEQELDRLGLLLPPPGRPQA
jgi:FMN phosphatase YigB (HAD superfamily)